MLADEMGKSINLPSVNAAAKELAALGNWDGPKTSMKECRCRK
jgi:NADH-quinone oxidoreductase subunit G